MKCASILPALRGFFMLNMPKFSNETKVALFCVCNMYVTQTCGVHCTQQGVGWKVLLRMSNIFGGGC